MRKKGRGKWIWLLLLVPVALGVARLRFDVEVLNLLPGKSPTVRGLKLYQRYFSNARELILALQSPDPTTGDAAARAIADELSPAHEPGDGGQLAAYLAGIPGPDVGTHGLPLVQPTTGNLRRVDQPRHG